MSSAYHEARQREVAVQTVLREVESSGADTETLQRAQKRLAEFEDSVTVLGRLANESKKVLWKSRHKNLVRGQLAARDYLNDFTKSFQASKYQREHEALMGQGLATVVIDNYQEETESLKRSEGHLEQYLEQGEGILASLKAQRQRLRGVSSKLGDLLSSVGVSQSLLRLANRQNMIDRFTVYGGMVLVILIFYVTYFFDNSVARFNLI